LKRRDAIAASALAFRDSAVTAGVVVFPPVFGVGAGFARALREE
jgi:hypothetical protein